MPAKKDTSPTFPDKAVPDLSPLDQLAPLVKDNRASPAAGLKPLPSPSLPMRQPQAIVPSGDPLDDLTPLDNLKPLDEEISPFHSGLTPLGPDALGSAGDDLYAVMPAASPASFQQRHTGSSQMVVMLPAIFQMLSTLPTVIYILIQGAVTLMLLIALVQRELPTGAKGNELAFLVPVGTLFALLLWFCAVLFIIKGSIDLMNRQSYISAVCASLMSLLFCTCGIGFPFGLWALIVLCFDDVRRSFRS